MTVAFSETEDISNNEDKFTCFTAQQRLLSVIKIEELQYEDNIDEYLDDAPEHESSSCINDFIHDMEINSKKFITTGDRPNPYYCPNFAVNLLRISKEFPLWTTVMVFNGISVASSARSEAYFNELKNLVFKGTKNIRADKFLISHVKSLAGTMKILNANTITSNETDEFSNKINQNEMNENEVYMST